MSVEAPVFAAMDRRLDPGSQAPLVVALSGGSDSLALLPLAVAWASERGRRVLALTVDHGLNPESARWTRDAGNKARAVGADWRALMWEGDKPTTGLPAKARAARHALLAAAAREAGARVILMGHTADDIAESEVMRATDTPGLGRLRDWAPSPAWPEGRSVFLLRPLLEVGRAELQAYLTARGEGWLDDPANENPAYARVRARQALSPAHPRGGGDPGFRQILGAGSTSGSPWIPGWLTPPFGSAGMSGWGEERPVTFDEEGATAPRDLKGGALAALLLCVSGTSQPPRGAELARLVGVIASGEVATLCGCRVDAKKDRVRITRAAPRRGQAGGAVQPVEWVRNRFQAACGLYADEASIPPP